MSSLAAEHHPYLSFLSEWRLSGVSPLMVRRAHGDHGEACSLVSRPDTHSDPVDVGFGMRREMTVWSLDNW